MTRALAERMTTWQTSSLTTSLSIAVVHRWEAHSVEEDDGVASIGGTEGGAAAGKEEGGARRLRSKRSFEEEESATSWASMTHVYHRSFESSFFGDHNDMKKLEWEVDRFFTRSQSWYVRLGQCDFVAWLWSRIAEQVRAYACWKHKQQKGHNVSLWKSVRGFGAEEHRSDEGKMYSASRTATKRNESEQQSQRGRSKSAKKLEKRNRVDEQTRKHERKMQRCQNRSCPRNVQRQGMNNQTYIKNKKIRKRKMIQRSPYLTRKTKCWATEHHRKQWAKNARCKERTSTNQNHAIENAKRQKTE